MKKNITKIVACAVALSSLSAVVPRKLIGNLGVQEAYASTKDRDFLEDITLEDNDDDDITIYTRSSHRSSSKLSKLDDDDEIPTKLYAKVRKRESKVNIDDLSFAANCELDYIKKGSRKYDEDDKISLSRGNNEIRIKVKNTDTDKTKTYTLKVYREGDDDDDDDDRYYDDDLNYDDIYLDDLSIEHRSDEIHFKFDEDKKYFNIDVDNDVNYIKVTAEPKDDDYKVRVDGDRVHDSSDYESDKIDLKEGKNRIVIRVEDDDDDERNYTLNITRKAKPSNSTSNDDNDTNTSIKNGWYVKDGKQCYNNSNGVQLRNMWFYDMSRGKSYFFNANGYMDTGWILYNSRWYLTDFTGAKVTGWQYTGGNWYYLDANGAMLTGWFKDIDGKYYYFDVNNGKMFCNTKIQGYKLGSNGAWVG